MTPFFFSKSYKISEIIVLNAIRLRNSIPTSIITILVLLSTGQISGVQFDIDGIKINPIWCVVLFLFLLNITISEKLLDYHYSHPIVFEKFRITREYKFSETGVGLKAHEKNTVTAKITDANSTCIKHSNNRVENSRLKYKLLKYNFDLQSPKDKNSQFECKCIQQTDTELIFKVNFPPQPANTLLEYELDFEYDQAQFAKKSELMDALRLSEIHRNYCVSGKRVRKPTKYLEVIHIFPARYRIIPDVFVSNFDGEMDTLRSQLQTCLQTIVDRNDQMIVTLTINNPLIGVLYAIKWLPPNHED